LKMADTVVAKYDYQAKDDKELNIRKNERLILLDDSKQWWKVQNNQNQSGFVPSNYVKKVKPSFFSSLRNTLGRKKGGEARTLCEKSQNGENVPERSINFETQTCDNTFAIAKYDYEANQDDELSISKGDRIVVLEKSPDGWWKGRKGTGQVGWFPSNYVTLEDDAQDMSMYANPASSCSENLSTDLEDSIETVVTLYAYEGSNSEELTFEKDELLEILQKPTNDPDWWRARNQRGDVGLVPKNYVQALSTDSGYPQTTPESQSNSSLSGQSHEGASSRTPSGGIRSRYRVAGPLERKDWYYGNIPRSECDQVLCQFAEDGDFVIRDSETNVS